MEQRRQPPQGRRRPVNVAEIMAQIRRRIEQKKKDLNLGTELEDLQAMRLKTLPDPQQVRPIRAGALYSDMKTSVSDLLSFKGEPPSGPLVDPFSRPPLEFDKPNVSAEALFYSSRGGFGRLLMIVRKLTRPILKLFVNVDAYVFEQAQVNEALRLQILKLHDRLHQQLIDFRDRDDQVMRRVDHLSAQMSERAGAINTLTARTVHYVQLLHQIQTNLVAELTKLAIENQNLKSRLTEINDRLDVQGKRSAILEEQVERVEEAVAPAGAPLDGSSGTGTNEPGDGA